MSKNVMKESEKKKMRMKEDESEEEDAEKMKKKPVHSEDGKLVKEDEDEEEDTEKEAEDEDAEKEAEDEDTEKAEDESEDEESEEEKAKRKKRYMKDEAGGKNPTEEAEVSNTSGHTMSPGAGVPSTQHVFVQPTNVSTGRNASGGSKGSGQSPSEVHYSGKSANPDLMKSPLFIGLSGQIEELQKSMTKKLNAVEKSFNDRIENMQKGLDKFYKNPLYKALDENIPETALNKSVNEQLQTKAVKFSG